jgi:hypothetical protein
MKYLLNRKLFELFDKNVRNYSLFDKFLNDYLNPSLDVPELVLGPRVGIVTLDLELTVLAQPAVVFQGHAGRHVPVSDAVLDLFDVVDLFRVTFDFVDVLGHVYHGLICLGEAAVVSITKGND